MRILLAAVLAAVAVLAALLAGDVRNWRAAIAQGDAVYEVTPGRAAWTPPTLLGGTAQTLLGTGDDIAARRALQLYAVAAATPNRLDTATQLQTQRTEATDALTRLRTSQANTLLGVLAFTQSADAALADFSSAVRADPANTAAKFDLELVLRLTQAHGSRTGSGPGGSFGRGGRRGAGGGVPGNGY